MTLPERCKRMRRILPKLLELALRLIGRITGKPFWNDEGPYA